MRLVALLFATTAVACFQPAKVGPDGDAGDASESDSEIATGTCAEEDAECDDGDLCTLGDRCESGRCVGTPKVCEAPATCREAGVCDGASGACTFAVSQDSTPCDDGDRCTAGDRCVSGVCEPTRAPDDSISDFAFVYGGRGGHRVAALAANSKEIWALVEFPATEVESPVLELELPNGSKSSVYLPGNAKHMLVLVRHSWRGEVQGHEVLLSSDLRLAAKSLSVADDGEYLVSVQFEGAVWWPGEGPEGAIEGTVDTRGVLAVRSTPASGTLSPWTLENDSTPFFDNIVRAGDACYAVTNVAGGSGARLLRKGAVVGSVATPLAKASMAHIMRLPGCADIVAGTLELSTDDNELIFVSEIMGGDDGGAAFGGISVGPLLLGHGGSRQFESVERRDHSFAFVLDPVGAVSMTLSVHDPLMRGSPILPFGLAHGADGTALSLQAAGRLELLVDGKAVAVADNPAGPEDLNLRGIAAIVGRDGARRFVSEFADRTPVFESMAIAGTRVWTVGKTDEAALDSRDGITMNPPPNGGGIVAMAFDGARRIFGLNLCAGDGAARVYNADDGLHLVRLPGTASVVIGGTLTASCKLGSARTKDVTVVEPTGFLTRINSGDALGCAR